MGLLGRAKTLMQGWSGPAPSRPQSYQVACPEGHRLRGTRTESYQALRCPTCGAGIFVLPRSPLPEPVPPADLPRARSSSSIEAQYEDEPIALSDPPPDPSRGEVAIEDDPGPAEVDIDWVDPEPVAPPPPTPSSEPRPAPAPAAPVPVPARPQRPTARAGPRTEAAEQAREPVEALPRPSAREWAWAHRNQLLAVAVILVIVMAVGIRQRRQRFETLPQVVEVGRTLGLKNLDAGDFQAAKKQLADAADALDSLGGTYPGSDEIRQGAREAAIFADLAGEGLDQILEKASTFQEVKDWPAHFETFYKGRSVIVESVVTDTPVAAKPDRPYQVATYLMTGRGPKPVARGRIDLAGFRLFELAEPKMGIAKTFGARLASLELDPIASTWVFRFEPESGVEMTHQKAMEKLLGSPEADEGGAP